MKKYALVLFSLIAYNVQAAPLKTTLSWCNGPIAAGDVNNCNAFISWEGISLKALTSVTLPMQENETILSLTDSSGKTWTLDLKQCQSKLTDIKGCNSRIENGVDYFAVYVTIWDISKASSPLVVLLNKDHQLGVSIVGNGDAINFSTDYVLTQLTSDEQIEAQQKGSETLHVPGKCPIINGLYNNEFVGNYTSNTQELWKTDITSFGAMYRFNVTESWTADGSVFDRNKGMTFTSPMEKPMSLSCNAKGQLVVQFYFPLNIGEFTVNKDKMSSRQIYTKVSDTLITLKQYDYNENQELLEVYNGTLKSN